MFDCDDYLSSGSDESLPFSPIYDRCQSGNGYHDVPPPYTRTSMPPKPDLVFSNTPNDVETDHPAFNVKLSPTKLDQDLSLTNRPSAHIIEDWVSNSEDESKTKTPQNIPSFVQSTEQVKSSRPSVQHVETSIPAATPKPASLKPTSNGKRRNRKACFVPVSTVVPKLKVTRLRQHKPIVTKPNSLTRRHIPRSPTPKASNSPPRVTAVLDHGNLQHALKDKGVIDSGCSRHMTGNMSYLSDFEELNGGYVAFGGNPKGGKIYEKGKIKTGKLDFDDVYFVKELKFILFSISQMCDKKNSVLFIDTECLVLSPEIKLPDESQVLLRVPRENNMYNVNLENIVPFRDLTCLFAKATIDESNLWHRRLGHINFKTINKLVKGNLVRALPTKVFENDNTCVACKKGKQHRASCKTKPVSSIDQPLYRLHIDLFGPTFVKSLNKKIYCLVITDDYSRVLVTKPHNKTSYELLHCRTPSIGFIRPFGCPVTILNALDSLDKLDGKVDKGFLVGYSGSSKAFRVFNSRTRIVQETLHVNFLENKPNVAGIGPTWLFDIDTLTKTMNYQPVTVGNQSNPSVGFQDKFDANTDGDAAFDEKEPEFDEKEPEFDEKKHESEVSVSPRSSAQNLSAEFEDFSKDNINEVNAAGTLVPTVGQISPNSTNTFSTAGPSNAAASPTHGKSSCIDASQLPDDPDMPELEDITYSDDKDDIGAEADFNNLETSITVSPILITRVHKDHPVTQIIGDLSSATQTRSMTRVVKDQAYVSFMGFMVYQMDVKSAFLYGTIEEEVYVCQPLRFEDPDYPDKVYKVVKAFQRAYERQVSDSSMGELTFFLGHQVKQKKDGIFISQDKYVADILRKFGLIDTKSASTPIDTKKPFLKDPDGEDVDVHTYISMIGSHMYLTSSRPDIMFAYPKDSPFDLVAYSDSDYAGASLDRKSTTGGCQFLGCRLISWQCKKQTVIATSSTEAEYVVAASCCAQVLWISNQLLDYGDHLEKFEGKDNDGFLVGYVAHSKAYQVYNLTSKKVEETLNLRYLEDKPNVQGLGQEWYFNLDYLTDSLGYQRFKTNPPAGTHDTNILAGIQADDSEFKCDEQVILVPYFPSNSFSAHSVAAKHGFEFSVDSAAMLPQAAIEIRRNLVPAAGAPAGSLVSTGGVPAGSVPASGVPAGSVPASGVPAGSVPASSVPAGRVLAGSIVFAEFGAPADSASVLAVFTTAPTDTSPLPPGYSLGSYKHSTRFPSPSDLGNRQPTTGIFSFSSYDDDFCANVTNLASNVVVDHVATKRVNTFHPQSQIIGALQSPVQTRSTVQKSKFSKSAFISYVHNQNRINHVDHLQCLFAYFFSQLEPSSVAKALEDPDWVAAMQKEMQQFYNQQGFEDPRNPKHVYKVVKALYGLHQAPRACQDKYVKDMLKKFDMESVRTATIPYEVPKHKSKDDPDDAVNVYLFRSMIGSLMYLTASRPDIMFAVSACSRHQLEAYSDNDYAGSHGDRKSTTGGWKFLGRRLISWQCKKQIIVATYSTKDEYVAAAMSCGLLLYFVSNVSRYPKLQVVQVLLLVALVHADDLLLIHADDLVPAGGCIIPTDSYSFMLVTWFLLFLVHPVGLVPTGSYVVPAVYVWFLLILKISNIVWDDHNKVAYLEKGKGWEAYEHILDILNCSHIRYALTHRTTIVFDSLVKQFWATATVHTLEAGPSDIIATIDVNEVVVTKSLISTQLQLNNVNGLYEFTLHDILDGMQAIGNSHYGYECSQRVPFVYEPEPCYVQSFSDNDYSHDLPSVDPLINHHCCYECGNSLNDFFCHHCTCEFCGNDCGVTHEPYQCQPENHDYYDEQNSCYDSNSFGFDQIQTPQYTVNHPIFNAHNDLLDSQNKLMEQMTSICEMVDQLIQKKLEEKQIEEEQAANARYWMIPA
nr:putative ribonuclease H-like domain-containing protein [Tanacetum cinerariifolium]